LEGQDYFSEPANQYVTSIFLKYKPKGAHESSNYQSFMGKLFFTYLLLDTLSWAEGWLPHPSLRVIVKVTSPALSLPLLRMLKNLAKWTDIIPNCVMATRNIFTSKMAKDTISQSEASSLVRLTSSPETASPEALEQHVDQWMKDDDLDCQILKCALVNLSKASDHFQRKTAHDLLYQWHCVTFCLASFKPVR
jgi:hypothetical protein